MILASYESPSGNEIELHRENGRFFTYITDPSGIATAVFLTPDIAREHYDYARDNGGHVFAHFPEEE